MQKARVHIAISAEIRDKLDSLKLEMKAKSVDDVIIKLIEYYYKATRREKLTPYIEAAEAAAEAAVLANELLRSSSSQRPNAISDEKELLKHLCTKYAEARASYEAWYRLLIRDGYDSELVKKILKELLIKEQETGLYVLNKAKVCEKPPEG